MNEDLVIEKEVVFGHVARRLPRPSENRTHHWDIFLYSPTGEDLGRWIDSVTFLLHETFDKPERVCFKEPYLISEDGWGEFDMKILIRPKCIGFSQIQLDHGILFPPQNAKKTAIMHRKTVKIVFRNPPPILYEGLSSAQYAWNKLKKEKKRLKWSQDADITDIVLMDQNIELKWSRQASDVSNRIRKEISVLSETQKAQRERIMAIIEEIESHNPDIAEVAHLFL